MRVHAVNICVLFFFIVLETCYDVYERLGISSDDVRDLLKNPEATILDYLKRSKYSYEEMLDQVQ